MFLFFRQLWGRKRWGLTEGKVIDKRHIRAFRARFDSSVANVSVDDYMIEFEGPAGKPARLVIKAQSVHLPVKGVRVGDTVSLHVNKKATRAAFGKFGPVVTRAERKQREKERRAKDEQRFKEKLNER